MILSFLKPALSIIKYKLKNKKKRIPIESKKLDNNSNTIIKILRKQGFAIIPNYLTKVECDKIISKIDFCLDNYKDKVWSDENFSDQRIYGSEIVSSNIMNFFIDLNLIEIAEKYTNYKIKNLMTMANRVKYIDKNKGSGAGWHKDAYYNQFKSILYLNDVTEVNGPFELIEDTNKIFKTINIALKLKKNYPNTRFSHEEIKKIKKKKIKTITGSAGTLILVDTSLIHRGSPLISGKRYALTNYYVPKDLYENLKKQFFPRFSFDKA